MKLKYYLRGIGIGMVVTSVIFILGGSSKQTMSDEEVIARAKELGLVENTVLSEWSLESQVSSSDNPEEITEEPETLTDAQQGKTEEETDTDVQSSSEEESESVSEAASDESGEEVTDLSTEESEQTEEDGADEADPEADAEYVTIDIVSGDSSWSVSQKAYDAGLVSSISEFDAYLCSNGYDRSLSVGQHKVRIGSDMKEIADALSGR